MPERWKLSLAAVAAVAFAFVAMPVPVSAGIPDVTLSFYVPQTGSVATPTEGTTAARLFRMCPNTDGTSFPNNSRIKVVVRDVNGNGIPGVAAADVCVLFNGGTTAQGFSGVGADSVIANSTWNTGPLCPDVRCVAADVPTDATGTTYVTFLGSDGVTPGVSVRNPNRKWGHYDTELPVYVLGFKLSGRLTTASANGTYTLRVKNFDWTGGLAAQLNQGEAVSITDFNGIANGIGVNNAVSYWRDFDSSGSVTSTDLNLITAHLNHNCTFPNNP
jgi:hypothetical protein